jgi:hypothetical protein
MRWLGLMVLLACASAQAQPERLFFDDFQHADLPALRAFGWLLRSEAGHPGVPGATWSPAALSLVDDAGRKGNRLLRLSARTDGTPEGTVQAQACHQRKLLDGTYAARIRFADVPESGADGDPVIQTFYAVSPLRFDFDPTFSEVDWEYLPNGGWGSEATRLYSIAWQTVRVEPWQAHNAVRETFGSFAGWRTLVMQLHEGRSRWFVDGREVALHGGRNHPVVPMAISFNLWFSPTGLLPKSTVPRAWVQDVDWVLHAADVVLSPAAVDAQVNQLRAAGRTAVDTVPAASPPLASECRF